MRVAFKVAISRAKLERIVASCYKKLKVEEPPALGTPRHVHMPAAQLAKLRQRPIRSILVGVFNPHALRCTMCCGGCFRWEQCERDPAFNWRTVAGL